MFLGARPSRERVFVRCRKGFIRLAMHTGTGALLTAQAGTQYVSNVAFIGLIVAAVLCAGLVCAFEVSPASGASIV